VWDLSKALDGVGSGLTIRVGLVADVVGDLLDGFKQSGSAEVFGLWMTSEEGAEEKREERQVRRVVEAEGKEFRLWTDEKYLIDEYVGVIPPRYLILIRLTAILLSRCILVAAISRIQIPATCQMSSRAIANRWSRFEMVPAGCFPPQASFFPYRTRCRPNQLLLRSQAHWRRPSRPCIAH
jgi:hypothetical protein